VLRLNWGAALALGGLGEVVSRLGVAGPARVLASTIRGTASDLAVAGVTRRRLYGPAGSWAPPWGRVLVPSGGLLPSEVSEVGRAANIAPKGLRPAAL
jgi:hypothetical protein